MIVYRISARVDQSEVIESWVYEARGISEAIDIAVERYVAMGAEAVDIYEAVRIEKGEEHDTLRTI